MMDTAQWMMNDLSLLEFQMTGNGLLWMILDNWCYLWMLKDLIVHVWN